MRNNARERGSVLIMVVLALGIFLLGAIGLGIDGSRLYAERQMAQAAADSAAQAGLMSIFNGTNATSPYPFATTSPPAPFTCSTTDGRTPCVYAAMNKFGPNAADTVYIDFPGSGEVPGIGALSSDPINIVRATVSRQVDTTLIRLLGPTATTVTAVAVAAILQTQSPTPIIVTHPTLPEALKVQGTPQIKICGGPDRSIQVNSSSGTPQNPGLSAYAPGGNANIDLSHAGPLDTAGDCTTGTGADFAVFGGPSAPSPQGDIVNYVNLGTAGDYLQPASPIADPLAGVPYPVRPANPGTNGKILQNVHGCPDPSGCAFYTPGYYTNGIFVKNVTAVFAPGIYYMDSAPTGGAEKDIAFGNGANGIMMMCTDCADFDWGGGVSGQGMLVYNSSPAGRDGLVFQLGANSSASLKGSPQDSVYKGILLFQRREAAAPAKNTEHRLGGGAALTLEGTVYITNTKAIMDATPAQYQPVLLQGGPGQGTIIRGQIIVSNLQLGGNGMITMNLNPDAMYWVRKFALVR